MNELYSAFFPVFSSILLAKYFKAFLTSKNDKLNANIYVAEFGVSYLILYFASKYAISRFLDPLSMPYMLVRVIVLACGIYAISFIFFKKKSGTQLFLLCSFFVVQEICQFVCMSLGNLSISMGSFLFYVMWPAGSMGHEEAKRFFDTLIVIGQFVQMFSYAFIFGLTLKSIIRNFIHKKYTLRITELSLLVLPCLTGLSLTYIIRAILMKPEGNGFQLYNEVPFIWMLTLISGVLVLLSIVATVKLFQKFIELHMEEKSKAVLQKQVEHIHEQVADVGDIYSELRGMRHDMKSHLSNIRLLVQGVIDGRPDTGVELEKYLGGMGETLDKFEFMFHTGNSISDVVIHQKYLDAKSKEIDFSADFIFPERLNLDAYDLAVILNNALENAIEASAAVSQSERFVRLYSYVKGGMFLIEIENSFTGFIVLDKNTGLPVSSKNDTETHGMGLSNIRRCAKKYFGDIDFQVSEETSSKVFRLTIMLQGRD